MAKDKVKTPEETVDLAADNVAVKNELMAEQEKTLELNLAIGAKDEQLEENKKTIAAKDRLIRGLRSDLRKLRALKPVQPLVNLPVRAHTRRV